MVVAAQIQALGPGVSLALFGHGLQLQQVSYVISSLLHYPLQSHQRVELTFDHHPTRSKSPSANLQ